MLPLSPPHSRFSWFLSVTGATFIGFGVGLLFLGTTLMGYVEQKAYAYLFVGLPTASLGVVLFLFGFYISYQKATRYRATSSVS